MDPASTPAPNSNPPAAAPPPNPAADVGGIPPIWEGLIAYLVFFRWKQASNLWRVLRGSVFVLLFLAFASLTELLLHFTGAFPEVEHFLTVQLHRGVQGVVIIIVLTLSIIVVSVHHFKEVKKPEYEFTFIKSVFDFTVGQHAFRPGASMKLAEALKKFGPIFHPAKLDCLALFYEHQEGQLSVKEHHVYPKQAPEKYADYFPVLPVGTGIAGRVYQDSCVRYMPICSLLRKPFLHALKFDIREGGNLSEEVPDFSTFRVHKDMIPFRSLLCVPLLDPDKERKCVGVLAITFTERRTLDRSAIMMAVVLGLALGHALRHLDLN